MTSKSDRQSCTTSLSGETNGDYWCGKGGLIKEGRSMALRASRFTDLGNLIFERHGSELHATVLGTRLQAQRSAAQHSSRIDRHPFPPRLYQKLQYETPIPMS